MKPFKLRFFMYFGRFRKIARATVFPENMVSTKKQFVLFYVIRLFFLVGNRLWKDRCPRQAAALAYQTFLSMVPLLVLSVAVASVLDFNIHLDKVTTFLEHNLLPRAAAEMGREINALVASINPATLGVVGGTTLVSIAVMLLFTVEQVVNEIFRCKHGRQLWLRITVALLLLLTSPVALGFSLYYSGKLLFFVSGIFSMLLPLVFTVIVLFFCYWLLPHRKIQKRNSFVSAVVAGIMLEIVKWGFALYAAYLGTTLSYLYGTMAIVPLFMVWVYATWLLFLFGAELNAALHEVKSHNRFA